MIDALDSALCCFNRIAPEESESEKVRAQKYIFKPYSVHSPVSTLNVAQLDEHEVDAAFPRFLAELDLSPENQKALLEQPVEKKWLMLTEETAIRERYGIGDGKSAEKFVEALQKPDLLDGNDSLHILEALFVSLRTQSHSYVENFVKLNGIECLQNLLHECRKRFGREHHAAALLHCFRALLNSTVGRLAVLSSDEILCTIASSACFQSAKCKLLCYEILAGICLITDGHPKVLHAITEARGILGERTRFQRLVDDIYRNYRNDRETDRVRTAAMSLINALLSSGPAENSLEFRMHLRIELLMLGLHSVLEQLRNTSSAVLDDHLDFFEMSRQEDEQHFARSDSGTSTPTDVENPTDIVDVLMQRLNSSIAMPHFISILQHLMLVPSDDKNVHLWRLFDIVLQQLILQAKMDVCADVREPVVNVDMDQVLSRLHTQHQYDNLEKMYNELEEELRRERMNVIELQSRLADYDGRSIYSRTSADSSDSTFPSDPCQSPSPSSSVPPVCPPLAPPPPPPPSSLQLRIRSGRVAEAEASTEEDRKNVPKSTTQLKTLNWTTIPKERIFGTIWENIDEEKIYQQLDLEDVTQNFAIGKASVDETDSISETLRRRYRGETAISVIEPRRAQNCTIMLSKLRLSNKHIKRAILSMDQYGELPRDMIEQMLKFMPTKEEILKLQETVDKCKSISVLPVADRFFYEISTVPRYEQRLHCLHIISTYRERIDDVSNTIETITNASAAITGSKRLRQLLRLILAIGNFLNRGKRSGNAYGFTLASLRVLTDVRNSLRSDRNLLHYIVEHIENKQPDILRLKRDLESVYQAARHSRKELEQELGALRKSIAVVTEELQASEGAIEDDQTWNNESERSVDRFVPVLQNFLSAAKTDLAQIEKQFSEMNAKFRMCVRTFAEEPRICSPDDFFGVVSKFLTSLAECHQQIWEERENLERIKKQTLARSILSKKSRQRDSRSHDFDQLVTALQSGEIFSEELTRLRTSFHSRRKSAK